MRDAEFMKGGGGQPDEESTCAVDPLAHSQKSEANPPPPEQTTLVAAAGQSCSPRCSPGGVNSTQTTSIRDEDELSPLLSLINGQHGFAQDFMLTLYAHLGLDGCAGLVLTAKMPYIFFKICIRWQWQYLECDGSFEVCTGDGHLQNPVGICRLPDGTLCVAESRSNRLRIIDQDGGSIRILNLSPRRRPRLHGPVDVHAPTDCVSGCGGGLFVADCDNHQILASPSLAAERPLWRSAGGEPGSALDQLTYPRGVAISPDGRLLFVADSGNHRVVVYDQTTLQPLTEFGGVRRRLRSPSGVSVGDQMLYNSFVAAATPTMSQSTLAAFAPMKRAHSPTASYAAPCLGETLSPFAIALHENLAFVCCHDSHVIMVFEMSGPRWHAAAAEGGVEGGVEHADAWSDPPLRATAASNATATAAAGSSARGGLRATAVRIIGRPGRGVGEFHYPRGVAILADLELLVVTEATRVQILTLDGSPRQVIRMANAGGLRRVCVEGNKLFITDSDDTPRGGAPGRVHVFRVRVPSADDTISPDTSKDWSAPLRSDTIGAPPPPARLYHAHAPAASKPTAEWRPGKGAPAARRLPALRIWLATMLSAARRRLSRHKARDDMVVLQG